MKNSGKKISKKMRHFLMVLKQCENAQYVHRFFDFHLRKIVDLKEKAVMWGWGECMQCIHANDWRGLSSKRKLESSLWCFVSIVTQDFCSLSLLGPKNHCVQKKSYFPMENSLASFSDNPPKVLLSPQVSGGVTIVRICLALDLPPKLIAQLCLQRHYPCK